MVLLAGQQERGQENSPAYNNYGNKLPAVYIYPNFCYRAAFIVGILCFMRFCNCRKNMRSEDPATVSRNAKLRSASKSLGNGAVFCCNMGTAMVYATWLCQRATAMGGPARLAGGRGGYSERVGFSCGGG